VYPVFPRVLSSCNDLTARIGILFEDQVIKISPPFCGSRKFIAVFTETRSDTCHEPCLSISHRRPISEHQFACFAPIYGPNFFFPSVFLIKMLYACYISPMHATCVFRPSLRPWFSDHISIWWRIQIVKFITVYFSSAPCYFLRVKSKFSL
jgi:hypothetical protein